jgi:hypothetical protein
MSEAERIKVLEKYLKEKDRRVTLSEVLFCVFFAYVSNALGWELMTYVFVLFCIMGIIYLVTDRSAHIFDDACKKVEEKEVTKKRSIPIMTEEEYEEQWGDAFCPPEVRIRQ